MKQIHTCIVCKLVLHASPLALPSNQSPLEREGQIRFAMLVTSQLNKGIDFGLALLELGWASLMKWFVINL